MERNSRPVYSSETGRLCPACSRPIANCACKRTSTGAASDGIIRLRYETKGRKGAGVTVITGLDTGSGDTRDFIKTLKKKCGTGGTVKPEQVEIQGDHRETVKKALEIAGFKVKGA
ncbi:MAG: stress response translation initiation inhibitor YciH [Pseudohongiellaceae bacterium]